MTDPAISAYMASLGKRSLQTMTPEQRQERARKAGLAKRTNKKI